MLTEKPNPRSSTIDQLDTLDMLRLINDEDAAVAGAVRNVLPEIGQAVDAITECFRAGGHLYYVGAGTSGRLAVLDAVECVPTFSIDPGMVQAIVAGDDIALTRSVEGAEDNHEAGYAKIAALGLTPRDIVVGIAASGRTPFVIGALEAAAASGMTTIAITCNRPAPMLTIAQIGIAVLVGPEVIAGSTRMKAGTAQKMILNMLSTASMIKLGKVYGNLMVDVKVTNQKLAARAQWIVSEVAGVTPDEAARLLGQTNQEAKTAIVVAMLGLTPNEARQRLAAANGLLRQVIDGRQSV